MTFPQPKLESPKTHTLSTPVIPAEAGIQRIFFTIPRRKDAPRFHTSAYSLVGAVHEPPIPIPPQSRVIITQTHPKGPPLSLIKAAIRTVKRTLNNLSTSLPISQKIRLSIRNYSIKIFRLRLCCGHPGQPGC